ncbi:ABC-three component system middle component 2 [Vibrio vulnificus]|uniref:ABC-three component system middle component 2 n=1 Tax=Vibrio vulnificus TaxID=672 RepID=UPI0005F2646E|nr:ABC-three component system middle component 2 [Vibrio vulnificus]MBF4451088.1 hypothetical protein [Vibrio vulnificus]MBF4496455.1 hypothetical protein [Vibrio vulnificus]MBL6181458.1 hypothetical protein [Vibrio vulnificus]HAS6345124.1 hypothetical protein [Vibrio vulnificus]HDY7981226.1 hypothetical protein [Vibrio vulnificus]
MKTKTNLAFNNHVEYGLRALAILKYLYPTYGDLDKLACLDYIVVHSGDFSNSLDSLHAPIPHRSSELYIRRSLMRDGLKLLCQYGLASIINDESGLQYVLTEEGEPFLDMLGSEYVEHVQKRAKWAVSEFGLLDSESIRRSIQQSFNGTDAEIAFRTHILRG